MVRLEFPGAVVEIARTLDGVLGFELLEVGEERVLGRMPIEDRVRQPWGVVHGGAYAAFAESLASIGTVAGVPDDMVVMGSSNQTSFLRPASEGFVHAEARRRHRGRTTWVWNVDFTDDWGRLCALSLMTIAVRPRPGAPA